MPTTCTEDTMIAARPQRTGTLFGDASTEADEPTNGSVLERCRAIFRAIGEQLSSFELSRQIYG